MYMDETRELNRVSLVAYLIENARSAVREWTKKSIQLLAETRERCICWGAPHGHAASRGYRTTAVS